eukprot:SRR837773.17335.p3 GENE.SRR837773.17335~~SRR837773.17335.p3  ORF type:complete len:291 (-),score=132.25 SRR837773.17335:39-911(-)
MVVNKLRGGLKICAVKAPGFGDNRKSNLQDIAVLTGGTVISEEVGLKLEDVNMDMLGTAKKVTVSKDDTIVLDGAGSKADLDERIELIQSSIESTTSEYEKEKLQERLAKLSGGVAVIKVGGATESEVGEKKDRVVDALNATKAAVTSGVLPGGGSALLHASKAVQKLIDNTENVDQQIGMKALAKAIKQPAFQIVTNAALEGAVVTGKLLEMDDTNMGFDAQKGDYCNMLDRGVLDPALVVRTGIVDAASVAGLLVSSDGVVVEAKSEDLPPPAAPMGGMGGGMGGMGF